MAAAADGGDIGATAAGHPAELPWPVSDDEETSRAQLSAAQMKCKTYTAGQKADIEPDQKDSDERLAILKKLRRISRSNQKPADQASNGDHGEGGEQEKAHLALQLRLFKLCVS